LGSSIRWKKLALFVEVFGVQNLSPPNKMSFWKPALPQARESFLLFASMSLKSKKIPPE
jgi:hypothetical protein